MGLIIPATNPVVAPAVGSVTYNQWFMTQLIVKASPTSAPAIVHLHRSATDANGVITLMPSGPGAEISFTLDIYQQLQAFPSMGSAMNSVIEAIIAYAGANNLL